MSVSFRTLYDMLNRLKQSSRSLFGELQICRDGEIASVSKTFGVK